MHSHSRRGGVLAGILIGLGILFVLAVVAAVGLGLFVAHNVKVTEKPGNTVVETPFGSLHVREGEAAGHAVAGLPVYPGATRAADDRKRASVELDFGNDSRQFHLSVATYTTPDAVEKVAAFYRERLPSWKYTRGRRGHVKIESSEGGSKRIVAISEENGVTKIGLASVGEPASN